MGGGSVHRNGPRSSMTSSVPPRCRAPARRGRQIRWPNAGTIRSFSPFPPAPWEIRAVSILSSETSGQHRGRCSSAERSCSWRALRDALPLTVDADLAMAGACGRVRVLPGRPRHPPPCSGSRGACSSIPSCPSRPPLRRWFTCHGIAHRRHARPHSDQETARLETTCLLSSVPACSRYGAYGSNEPGAA